MSYVSKKAVKNMQNAIDEVNIYAFEGDIYTVGVRVGNDEMTLCNDQNKPMHFKSLAMAKALFKKCTSAKTSVICSQPYDEMIGLQSASVTEETMQPRQPR